MTELRPPERRGESGGRANFWPKNPLFGHIFRDINFKLGLPITYLMNDGQTNFEVNWTLFHHLSP